MNIVVLDGYTLNPGDLSWKHLEMLGNCTIYDRTPPELIVERAKDAEVLLTNKTILSAEIIGQLTGLKYIGVLATGYNVVDISVAKSKGIPVTNIPTYGTESVAQMVFAHILNLTQKVEYHANTVKEGKWAKSIDFCYWDFPLIELKDLTLGIIGAGRIGQATAALGLAFGMKVLAYDVFHPKNLLDGIVMKDLDTVLSESDVISLHCPLTSDMEKLINSERIGIMKNTAFLINTSRGPLIDETVLADALNNNKLAGAGLDVLSIEPPSNDNPLYNAKNCFITPHIAWATKSARSRLMDVAVNNVIAFQEGNLSNVVHKLKN
jgi:glycerate dehydrogenase